MLYLAAGPVAAAPVGGFRVSFLPRIESRLVFDAPAGLTARDDCYSRGRLSGFLRLGREFVFREVVRAEETH